MAGPNPESYLRERKVKKDGEGGIDLENKLLWISLCLSPPTILFLFVPQFYISGRIFLVFFKTPFQLFSKLGMQSPSCLVPFKIEKAHRDLFRRKRKKPLFENPKLGSKKRFFFVCLLLVFDLTYEITLFLFVLFR